MTIEHPQYQDLKKKYKSAIEFIESVANTESFSTANHWDLAKSARKFINKIGELTE